MRDEIGVDGSNVCEGKGKMRTLFDWKLEKTNRDEKHKKSNENIKPERERTAEGREKGVRQFLSSKRPPHPKEKRGNEIRSPL